MNSENRTSWLRAALLACMAGAMATANAEDRTWRTVAEMAPEDRALFDPAIDSPRSAKLPYAPAEAWPFKPPYTAEEMGYRAAEFTHISRWPHLLVDVYGVITSSGYINQGAGVTYVLQNTAPGFGAYMNDVPAGAEYSRWMIYYTFPPEAEAVQQLWIPHRTDANNRTKMDFFAYAPELRRVRRMPQPRRDERFPDNAQTFDDVMGRDPWEFSWELLGTDVIHETVRLPNTRPTLVFNVPGQGYVEKKASELRPMGPDYPYYRADGGVDCWVVKASVREDVLPDYKEKVLVYWLDKHYFFPIRMEKYDAKGELIMIETRNAAHENPALGEFGYAAGMTLYWDIEHDIMSYSAHDGHFVKEWTPEEAGMLFTAEFMRRQWLYQPTKSQLVIDDPEQYFLRPRLLEERFPAVRKITLSPELAQRVAAQEAAGKLVFASPDERQTADSKP